MAIVFDDDDLPFGVRDLARKRAVRAAVDAKRKRYLSLAEDDPRFHRELAAEEAALEGGCNEDQEAF